MESYDEMPTGYSIFCSMVLDERRRIRLGKEVPSDLTEFKRKFAAATENVAGKYQEFKEARAKIQGLGRGLIVSLIMTIGLLVILTIVGKVKFDSVGTYVEGMKIIVIIGGILVLAQTVGVLIISSRIGNNDKELITQTALLEEMIADENSKKILAGTRVDGICWIKRLKEEIKIYYGC